MLLRADKLQRQSFAGAVGARHLHGRGDGPLAAGAGSGAPLGPQALHPGTYLYVQLQPGSNVTPSNLEQ